VCIIPPVQSRLIFVHVPYPNLMAQPKTLFRPTFFNNWLLPLLASWSSVIVATSRQAEDQLWPAADIWASGAHRGPALHQEWEAALDAEP
jgi:hypothetical protein